MDGAYNSLIVFKSDKDFYSFCVGDGETVSIDLLFTHANGDIDGFLRAASSPECGTSNNSGLDLLASGFSSSDNELVTWTNSTGASVDVVLEVDVFDSTASDCNTYDMMIAGGGCDVPVGTAFCDPGNNNSTGFPTVLAGSAPAGTLGAPAVTDLHLEATSGPAGQFGYFLIGTTFSDPGLTVSQGRLCLSFSGGGVLGRYNIPGTRNSLGVFDAGGVMQNLSGTSASGSGFDVPVDSPLPGSPTIMGWGKRTTSNCGTVTSRALRNFSNGLTVTF